MIAAFKQQTVDNGLEARIAGIAARRQYVSPVAAPNIPSGKPAGDAPNGEPLRPNPTPARPTLHLAPETEASTSNERRPELHTVAAREELIKELSAKISGDVAKVLGRREVAKIVDTAVGSEFARKGIPMNAAVRRGFVTEIIQELLAAKEGAAALSTARHRNTEVVEAAKERIFPLILEHMDVVAATEMARDAFETQLSGWVTELLVEAKIQLNFAEQRELIESLLADMMGLGPLEPLIADETVSDIMVNGAKQVYVERRGKVELTNVKFRDDEHLMNVCTKIVTRVGRRIDESKPLVDARLPDGSRVNIIIPPLAIDGPAISIRKFSKKTITLDTMVANGSISPAMATLLKVAARCRLNILISGGTGSGKTTLLNALSRLIDDGERTVTIEDAAELQLQQPHVVRLETRIANLEGTGEVTIRELLRNALRMRPDRIVIGECRGEEAFDMLQAMNTGHDGSMSTIHANNPREALTRLENMIRMAGMILPPVAMRVQIASAVNLICQAERMRDGRRRVTRITEVVGMEGEVITTQDLFTFVFEGEDVHGKLRGTFQPSGIRPRFLPRAEYFGLDRVLLEVI